MSILGHMRRCSVWFAAGALVPIVMLWLKPVTDWKGTVKRIPSIFSIAHESGAAKKAREVTRQRVAILTAGTVARFHLNTSAEHLATPLVQSGWEVDYFVSLFLGLSKAWHAGVEKFEADWEFQQVNETHIIETGWWFQIFLLFSSLFGEMIQFD